MYRPMFVRVGGPAETNIDIELPIGTEIKIFSRPKDEAIGKTLERVRLAFAPKPTPGAPKVKTPSFKDSPTAKEAIAKNQKDERLKKCPEAFVFNADESMPVDAEASNAEAFVAENVLQVGDMRWRMILNVPRIKRFTPPPCLIEGCPAVPAVVEAFNVGDPTRDLQWRWMLGDDVVCMAMVFVPTPETVGKCLTVQCCDAYSHHEAQRTPPVQRLTSPSAERIASPLPPLPPGHFRVVTYNILHDSYADSDYARTVLYPYVRPELLELHYREVMLGKELGRYNADLLCLQEVGGGTYDRFLLPLFQQLDFSGVYETKFKTLPTNASADEILNSKDGCAILYNRAKFDYVEHVTVPLTMGYFGTPFGQTPHMAQLRERIQSSFPFVAEALTNVSTIAVIMRLRCRNSGRAIVVANTHLFFHPDATHIRALQGYMLGDAVAAFRRCDNAAVVLCGDLNNPPDGIVRQLYHTGAVGEDHPDWKDSTVFAWDKVAAGDRPRDFFHLNMRLPPDMEMRDSCAAWDIGAHTNVTPHFSARLDYVFFTPASLAVDGVLPNPSEEELHRHTALPSEIFPSDHVAVVVDLSVT